jgi:hypothetical protein
MCLYRRNLGLESGSKPFLTLLIFVPSLSWKMHRF